MKIFFQRSICTLFVGIAPFWGMPGRSAAAGTPIEGSPIFTVGIPVTSENLEKHRIEAVPVRLGAEGFLRGVVKTADGKPAAGAPVVLGVRGKPVTRVQADRNGEFRVGPLKSGEYQLATRDAAVMLAVFDGQQGPPETAEQVELSRGAMTARGQEPGSLMTNPWFWGLIVFAAVAVPFAIISADDDNS